MLERGSFTFNMPYTVREFFDIIIIYGETGGSINRTYRVYRQRYPNRRRPSYNCIRDVVFRLADTGVLLPNYEGRGRESTRRVLRAEEELLQVVERNPSVSTRVAARQVGVSRSTVHRIFRRNLLHPYHIQRVQELTENDRPLRVTFCTWFRQRVANDVHFCAKVLFTDECCFTRNGIINFHNAHNWSDVNPHATRQQRFQHRFSVNVWAGILGDTLLGPHVLPQRLNAASYLEFLENVLPNYLDDVPLLTRTQMWFMHDGAPPHFSRRVRDFLNATYPRWIGRGGPTAWPPRSPDLNPLDFFLWGYMHTLIYEGGEIENVEELQQRIFNAAQRIRREAPFPRIRDNYLRRMGGCLLAEGGHMEHFM